MAAEAKHLAEIAVELIVRIRDDSPEDNGRWLTAHLPDPGDWFRLAFVLAAAVPDDRSWQQLTAWTRRLGCTSSPSGHRRRGEPVCEHCRRVDRERKRPVHAHARTTERSAA
jgi:hypothetical protein